jgi:hypothetical protein
MNQNISVGLFGTFASWGLSEVHLVGALIASVLTSVYMIVSIIKTLRK